MSNLDITNNYEIILTDLITLTSSTTFFTTQIDLANADPGFAFTFITIQPLDGMEINIKLQDNDGSGWVDIPDNKIISVSGTNLFQILVDQPIPGTLGSLGAFSNSKLVRAEITVTNYNGDVEIASFVYIKTEQLPPSVN